MHFKSQHDSERFGPLNADMTPAGELRSLADLVRFLRARDGWPLREAAVLASKEIEAAQQELFETQPGTYARRIDDGWSWTAPDDRSFWEGNSDEPPQPVQGHAGALKQLRDWAAAIKFPADLEAEPCVRFAIRASTAAELFGYGAEAEAPPALPSTLPQHDAKRWGSCRTVEARPRDVLRLGDVVQAAMAEGAAALNGLAPKRAAAWLLGGLAGLGKVPWFELDPNDVPQLVPEDREWRPAYPSGAARRAEFESWDASRSSRGIFDYPDAEEAAARGLSSDPAAWPWLYGPETAGLPALPALRGAAGLVEWLRIKWVERIASVDELDSGELASLAIPARDVARLPWLASAASVAAEPAQAVPASAVAPAAAPAHLDAETLAEKRKRAVESLRALGDSKGARNTVAAEFEVNVRTIGKWVAAVEAEEKEERAAKAREASFEQLTAGGSAPLPAAA